MIGLRLPARSWRDVVTGFNSFQYAARPVAALAEAVRVVKPDGQVLLLTWGTPEQCEAAGYLAAIGQLLPPPPPGAPGPFALSEAEALTALYDEAGLRVAAPVVFATEHAGEEAVRQAATEFLAPFRTDDGGYRLTNTFRYVIGTPR